MKNIGTQSIEENTLVYFAGTLPTAGIFHKYNTVFFFFYTYSIRGKNGFFYEALSSTNKLLSDIKVSYEK